MKARLASLGKYSTLGSLYFTQLLPFSFFSMGLPVIMRQQGYSLEQIGYLHLIGIPYILNFLWSPLIDRFSPGRSHYRSWIFILTPLYALTVLSSMFFSFDGNLTPLILLLTLAIFFIATQDIAVDALSVRFFPPSQRGMANGIQAAGGRFGYLVGGGIFLMTYRYIGWQGTIILMCSLLLVSVIPLIFTKEPLVNVEKKANYGNLVSYFKNRRWVWTVLLLTLSAVPISVITHKFRPLLVDRGMDEFDIGIISGIIGMAAGVLGALTGGFLMKQLKRRTGFLLVLGFKTVVCALLLIPAYSVELSFMQLAIFVAIGGFASAMGTATIMTIFMDQVRKGSEGTDFTLQNSLSFVVTALLSPIAGRIADKIDYSGLFLIALSMGILIFFLSLFITRNWFKTSEYQHPTDILPVEKEIELGQNA